MWLIICYVRHFIYGDARWRGGHPVSHSIRIFVSQDVYMRGNPYITDFFVGWRYLLVFYGLLDYLIFTIWVFKWCKSIERVAEMIELYRDNIDRNTCFIFSTCLDIWHAQRYEHNSIIAIVFNNFIMEFQMTNKIPFH